MLRNGLQAVALSHRLRLGPKLFTVRGQQQFAALPLTGAFAIQRQHSLALLASLAEQVHAVEQALEARAQHDLRVARLRTHPGVGLLTALAVVHALEPVSRFDRARRVAAYCRLEASKNSSVAIVAVARKLVLRLYRMLRDEIDYDQFRRRGRDARRAREFASPPPHSD